MVLLNGPCLRNLDLENVGIYWLALAGSSDRFCTMDLGGEEVPCVVMEGSTSYVAPSMPGYLFVDIYDASQADKDTPAGKVNYQLQQLIGSVRLDATADPTVGGVGVLFTDEVRRVHTLIVEVKYVCLLKDFHALRQTKVVGVWQP